MNDEQSVRGEVGAQHLRMEKVALCLTVLALAVPLEAAIGMAARDLDRKALERALSLPSLPVGSGGADRMAQRLSEKLGRFDPSAPSELFLAVWVDPQVCCGQDSRACWQSRAERVQAALRERVVRGVPRSQWAWTQPELEALGVRSVKRVFELDGSVTVAYAQTHWGSDWYALPPACG